MTDIVHYLPHIAGTSGLAGLLIWLGKKFIGSKLEAAKAAWQEAMSTLDRIDHTASVQAGNHLAHIQESSQLQTELLTTLVAQQAETNGSLRTLIDVILKK